MSSGTDLIRAASAKWVQAFNVKDGAGIAAVYTHDAVLLPPDAGPIEGVEAMPGSGRFRGQRELRGSGGTRDLCGRRPRQRGWQV